MTSGGGRPDDAGSATVWVLVTGLVFVLVASAVALAGAATVARHRARAAADLAAFGAALQAWDSEPVACAWAAELSSSNGARLVSCRLEGFDAVVEVEVSTGVPGLGAVRASARAGPVESGTGPVASGRRLRCGADRAACGMGAESPASRPTVTPTPLWWQDAGQARRRAAMRARLGPPARAGSTVA